MGRNNNNPQTEQCNLHIVSGSGFKNEMLKAFLAGKQLAQDNKLTSYDNEGEEIEHSGFNGWFHYHYR